MATTTLSVLSLTAGSDTVDLSPAFSSGTSVYTASVANGVTQIAVSTTLPHSSATEYIAVDTDTDATFAQVDLTEGENVITITVVAANGMALQRHTITVTREAPVLPVADPVSPMAEAGDGEIIVTWTAPTVEATTHSAPEGYDVCTGVTGGRLLWIARILSPLAMPPPALWLPLWR